MIDAAWSAQAFPPQGASAAEGIRNQLGRPELDLLTILVREAAQNSWDARLNDRPVDFRIDLRAVSPAHAPAWRELLLRNVPAPEQLPLRASLTVPTIRILTVSDRGTNGLGGPTRADNAVVDGHDFVSFVRNIGEPRDTDMGGGTYGFGKGIFYLLSRPGTVLVHTRCATPNGYQTRLIGCALWKSYTVGAGMSGRRFTGRHWWGALVDEVVEPLTGEAADKAAQRLGLRPYDPDETGTSVVMIDPDLGERAPFEAAEYLAETITWNLWPKMLSPTTDAPPAMRFGVQCDGVEVPVPDPREIRPVDLFVAAYTAMESDVDSQVLWCKRPKKRLGTLGLEKRFVSPGEPTSASRAAGIEHTVHHVCLMRTAELVVTYHAGPKPPAEHISYAGVFRADPELDSVYAQSEPPTHDAWHWQPLDGDSRTFVRTTFQRLKEALEALLDISSPVRSASSEVPLGAASRVFSSLVAGAWGGGAATSFERVRPLPAQPPIIAEPTDTPDVPTSHSGNLFDPAGSTWNGQQPTDATGHGHTFGNGADDTPPQSPTRRPRVEYLGEPYFDMRSGRAVLIQDFRIPVPGSHRVRVELAITLPGTGGRETDPPRNADRPEFFGWEDDRGILHRDVLTAIDGGDRIWRALVRPAADTVTEIGLVATRESGAR